MAELRWTLPGAMEQMAQDQPDVKNFTFVDTTGTQSVWTAKEVYVAASRFAAKLRNEYGFIEGDILANAVPNSPERLITDLGVILAGCVIVNCQIIEKDGSDFWNTARLSTCKAVILPAKKDNHAFILFSSLVPNLKSVSGLVDVTVPQAPKISKLLVIHRDNKNPKLSLLESLKSEDCPSYCHNAVPTDLAVLFATSGSSGFCKLVPRTHEEVLKAGRLFEATKDIKYFNDRPFGWMGGFPFDYLARCGIRILQDQLGNKEAKTDLDLWRIIEREQCTGAALLPTQITSLMAKFKDSPLPKFKLGFLVTGSQPLRKELAETIGVITHALVVSYGSTEATMVCMGVVTSLDQSQDFFSGKANKGCDIKVVDEETGKDVESGVTGSIVLKSPVLFKGYFNQPELALENFLTEDGWYKTGDLGRMDADGNLYCIARAGDSVNQGSVVVYSSWPETVLCKCPDVIEVSVVKLPSSTDGQEGTLCACVVKREGSDVTEDTLLRWYKDSFMKSGSDKPGFIPELSRVVFVDTLPLLDSGKVSKRELLRTVTEMLDLG